MIDIKDVYIDFDEVIFPTWRPMYEDYQKLKIEDDTLDLTYYVETYNWKKLLDNIEPIPGSIETLKELKEAIILTKVNSIENEATAKINKLRSLGIKNEVIICPYESKKTDIVDPRGKVLVDDTVHNLDDWYELGGIPIFFNKNNEDIDGWGKANTKYQKIKSLSELKNIKL